MYGDLLAYMANCLHESCQHCVQQCTQCDDEMMPSDRKGVPIVLSKGFVGRFRSRRRAVEALRLALTPLRPAGARVLTPSAAYVEYGTPVAQDSVDRLRNALYFMSRLGIPACIHRSFPSILPVELNENTSRFFSDSPPPRWPLS